MERKQDLSGDKVANLADWLNSMLAEGKANKLEGVGSTQGESIRMYEMKDAGLITICSDNKTDGLTRVYWSEDRVTQQLISAGLIEPEAQAARS